MSLIEEEEKGTNQDPIGYSFRSFVKKYLENFKVPNDDELHSRIVDQSI